MTNLTTSRCLTNTFRTVYLDGQRIFDSLVNGHGIGAAGSWEAECTPIYIGEGGCCNGHLYRLMRHEAHKPYAIDAIVTLPFGPGDILPVAYTHKENSNRNDTPEGSHTVLVVGRACEGAGVRLVGTYPSFVEEVVSHDEHCSHADRIEGEKANPIPAFRVNQSAGTIHVDFRRAGYRVKQGQRRDPTVPACLVTAAEEHFVSSDVVSTMDITPRLRELGVDVEKTMELVASYRPLPYRGS